MTQIAGSVSLFLGLGFGLPCVFAIRHFAQTGEVLDWTGPIGSCPPAAGSHEERPVDGPGRFEVTLLARRCH